MAEPFFSPEGFPEAVLVRGAQLLPTHPVRNAASPAVGVSAFLDGPGKLTKTLSIDRTLNKENLATSRCLWIEDDGATPPPYSASKRIGIAYAKPRDRNCLWRFTVK